MDFQAGEETCSRVAISDLDIRSQVTGLESAQFLYPKDELFFTAATFMDMEVPALGQLKNISLFSGPTGFIKVPRWQTSETKQELNISVGLHCCFKA